VPTTNYTKVTTTLVSAGPPPENWIEVAAIPVDEGDVPDDFTEDAKAYESVASMLADGWVAADAAVVAATNYFGQGEYNDGQIPTRVVVVKRATPVAQVDEFEVLSAVDGTYKLFIATIGGSAVEAASFAAVASTTTLIKDGLISSFNAGVFAPTQTAASTGAATGTITSDVLGAPFILTGTAADAFDIDTTTPNVGIYEDLDAGWRVEPFWMVLPDPTENEGTLIEASRWAEGGESFPTRRRNVIILPTTDADILDSTEPNFADTMILLGRNCSFVLYHPNTGDKMGASFAGRYIKIFPGSKPWHYGYVKGTTETTTINYEYDEGENMKDARCSWIERDGEASTDFIYVFGGVGSGGYTLEQKMTEHYWWLKCTATMKKLQQAGVDLTDDGLAQIKSSISLTTAELGSSVDQSSLVITPVPLEDVPAAELAVGDYMTSGGVSISITIPPKLRGIALNAKFTVGV
jgi:hypothetical protein